MRGRRPLPKLSASKKLLVLETAGVLAAVFQACAADPRALSRNSSSLNEIQEQADAAGSLSGARVLFHYADFYSLTAPNSASCAGDVRNFYDLYSVASGATSATGSVPSLVKLEEDVLDSNQTTRPSFIRNVSVDMTDSNAGVPQNLAFSCSYGNGDLAPPVSSCSTFDYGAIGGIPTSMGGSLLIVGGIQGFNFSGHQTSLPIRGHTVSCGPVESTDTYKTRCDPTFFALGVESLPASVATDPPSTLAPGLTGASGPISTWVKISGLSGYSGPLGAAGAAATYSSSLQRLMIFGGAAPLSGVGPTGVGVNTFDTWTFDLQKQKWAKALGNPVTEPQMQITADNDGTTIASLFRGGVGRALHGYVAAQSFGLSRMTTTGDIQPMGAATTPIAGENIDRTDYLISVGGLSSITTLTDTQRFNPTFGPLWVDAHDIAGNQSGAAAAASSLTQWMESFPTGIANNRQIQDPRGSFSSQYIAELYEGGSAAFDEYGIYGAGIVPLRRNVAATSTSVEGLLGSLGGFKTGELRNLNAAAFPMCNNETFFANGTLQCGPLLINAPYVYGQNAATERTTNFLDRAQIRLFPGYWTQVTGGGTSANNLPYYGGVSAVQGLNKFTNEVFFFGGTDCPSYLPATGYTPSCEFNNPGKIVTFGADPGTFTPTDTAFAGTIPSFAGMASARGFDNNGNALVLAYGGMNSPGNAPSQAVSYLAAGSGNTWYQTTPAGVAPAIVGNGQIVYSHVTRKFYLFGGYAPLTSYTSGDTWELSILGGNCAAGTCTFAWKQLNSTGGLTCYPYCPEPRRSHRMAEVNYYNRNPGGVNATSGLQACTNPAEPCSYGIFMEGGTADGVTFFADRWMFDPTANGGRGHWQRVGDFPPRTLASSAAISYTVPNSGTTVHRAILFGGETAMQTPLSAANAVSGSTNYFVAPTLGDTWMFDFGANTWNRVRLLGRGYNGAVPTNIGELEMRAGYNANAPFIPGPSTALYSELSPPPLSGSVMVTRTLKKPTHTAAEAATSLKIPEVYLFGGRTKDGSFLRLDSMYKFCAGAGGETAFNGISPYPSATTGSTAADNSDCDAYDATTNPYSPSPVFEYVGRWLRKEPTGSGMTPAITGAYQAAATYDPLHDLIVLTGGLKGAPGFETTAITDTTNLVTNTGVYEYTPSSQQTAGTQAQNDGQWTFVSSCTGYPTPPGRYGHAMGYDTLNRQVVISGGYDAFGNALTQTLTFSDGTSTSTPDVWTGRRVDQAGEVMSDGTPITLGPFPCYYFKQITTYGNAAPSSTADSPPTSGIGNAAAVFIPSSGYNTGFYSMFDNACAKVGPISTPDPNTSKLLAGGVYIDIDRQQLDPYENLLLNITYLPMAEHHQRPDTQKFPKSETAFFKVHLLKTGQTQGSLMQALQPRHLIYSAEDQYPKVVETLTVLAPPTGELRTDQVVIPLTIDPNIDRIRIERYSGSGILVEASIHRMGQR